MTADEIMDGLARAYALAQAYRDRGRVLFVRARQTANKTTVGKFRTTFNRSTGLDFEFREVPADARSRDPSAARCRKISVRQGKVVDVRGIQWSGESVSSVVTRITGVTFGAAHCVPKLLLSNEIAGRALIEARSCEVVRIDTLDRRKQFVIRLEGIVYKEIVVDEEFVLRRVISLRPSSPTEPSEGLPVRPMRVLSYDDAELFAEEQPAMTAMDW